MKSEMDMDSAISQPEDALSHNNVLRLWKIRRGGSMSFFPVWSFLLNARTNCGSYCGILFFGSVKSLVYFWFGGFFPGV